MHRSGLLVLVVTIGVRRARGVHRRSDGTGKATNRTMLSQIRQDVHTKKREMIMRRKGGAFSKHMWMNASATHNSQFHSLNLIEDGLFYNVQHASAHIPLTRSPGNKYDRVRTICKAPDDAGVSFAYVSRSSALVLPRSFAAPQVIHCPRIRGWVLSLDKARRLSKNSTSIASPCIRDGPDLLLHKTSSFFFKM